MKPGDHIRIHSDGAPRDAIDVGDRTALHFSPHGSVCRTLLSELAPHGSKVVVVTHSERVYPPRMVVARAFSRLAEAASSAMFADSEAFATWCKTGRQPPAPLALAAPGPADEVPAGAVAAASPSAAPKKRAAPAAKRGATARKRAKGKGVVPAARRRATAAPRKKAAAPAKKGGRSVAAPKKKSAGRAAATKARGGSRTRRPAAIGAKRGAPKRAGARKRS